IASPTIRRRRVRGSGAGPAGRALGSLPKRSRMCGACGGRSAPNRVPLVATRAGKRRGHPMPVNDDVRLGTGVKIFHPQLVNLYGCVVGADTKIGAFVEIQKNASVGARCKISSHTFVCEGVTIEDEVFVGHGVMFIND